MKQKDAPYAPPWYSRKYRAYALGRESWAQCMSERRLRTALRRRDRRTRVRRPA